MVAKQDKTLSAIDAGDFADGRIFGKRDFWPGSDFINKTRLWLARTVEGKARPRRELLSLSGVKNPRPLTARHIEKLRIHTDEDALDIVYDFHLFKEKRDWLDAVYRLSFHLEPGARNPLLEVEPIVVVTPTSLRNFDFRSTTATTTNGIEMFAWALSQSNLHHGYVDCLENGCGFTVLRFDNKELCYVRPEISLNGIKLRQEHRDEIEKAIVFHFSTSEANSTLQKLDVAWKKSAAKEHSVWSED